MHYLIQINQKIDNKTYRVSESIATCCNTSEEKHDTAYESFKKVSDSTETPKASFFIHPSIGWYIHHFLLIFFVLFTFACLMWSLCSLFPLLLYNLQARLSIFVCLSVVDNLYFSHKMILIVDCWWRILLGLIFVASTRVSNIQPKIRTQNKEQFVWKHTTE